MKRSVFISVMVVLLGVCGAVSAAEEAKARTLLLIPAEEDVIKVAFDVGNAYPTVLLCYKAMPNDSYALKGWTGEEWLSVSGDAYKEGTFFKAEPSSTLLISQKGQKISAALIPPEEWCSTVYGITTTEMRPLLHLIGRHYDFSAKSWKQFASTYQFDVRSINPENINMPWYHRSLKENTEGATQGENDFQFLTLIREPKLVLPVEEIDEGVSADELNLEPIQETKFVDELVPAEEVMETEISVRPEVPEAVIHGSEAAEEVVP
ncbi:MAG: hypothetical protein PF495_12870 [Spirochaetales bacterium]|jgi:hypothetical protein|nr:hypothetical protein [Spirochaetales bacterium]